MSEFDKYLAQPPADTPLLSDRQLLTLYSLTYVPADPFFDEPRTADQELALNRTAVAAEYTLEGQYALRRQLLEAESAQFAENDLPSASPTPATDEAQRRAAIESSLHRLHAARMTANDPNAIIGDSLNDQMGHAARGEISADLQRDFEENFEHKVDVRTHREADLAVRGLVARTAAKLSPEQVQWEVDHGALKAANIFGALPDDAIDVAEDSLAKSARRAFQAQAGAPLSSEALTRAMQLPRESAATVISHMVRARMISRDSESGRLVPAPALVLSGWQLFGREFVYALRTTGKALAAATKGGQ